MNDEYEREKDADLRQDAMTQGEYLTEAVAHYAAAYGAEDPTRAWILAPVDTWEHNPYYVGPPVPHPEEERNE